MESKKFSSILQLLLFFFTCEVQIANSSPGNNPSGHAIDSPRTSSARSSTSEYLSASSSPLRDLAEHDIDAPKTSSSNLPERAIGASKAFSSDSPGRVTDDARNVSGDIQITSSSSDSRTSRRATETPLASQRDLSRHDVSSAHAIDAPKTSKRTTDDAVRTSLSRSFTRRFQITSTQAPSTSSSKLPDQHTVEATRTSSSGKYVRCFQSLIVLIGLYIVL
jgi:hypothetical protein